jgi:AraC family transcriptional regulator of adaptative response/methylated-DNA-[protein]-cysteine methyltransferase
MPPEDVCYDALVRRDPEFEGLFYTCVKTTGIFCRPTCKAKRPRRENVEFAPTAQSALSAGYRACKLCKPLAAQAARPEWMDGLLAEVRAHPGGRIADSELTKRGLDPATVRKRFKAELGMTFQAYQRSVRLGGAMRQLRKGAGEMQTALATGYESTSGFREAFSKVFGEAPGKARRNGAQALVADWLPSPLGTMLAVASETGLAMLEFVDRRALENELIRMRKRMGAPIVAGSSAILEQTKREMAEYFEGARRDFTIPLDLRGSEFQLQVWNALCDISFGRTESYGQMAKRIGRPSAVRAIGRANGTNQVAIVVPCHRVIGADGTLTGYGGGLWRKEWLLEHEGVGREGELFGGAQ